MARAVLAVFLLALGLPAAALPQSAGTTVGGATARAVADRDQVAVLEVTGNFDQKLPDGSTNADPRAAVAREFLKSHPDEYDFLIAWSTFEFNTGEARAFYLGIRNDVQGIGEEVFDNSDYFGSNHKLQGYVDMAALSRGTTDPLNAGFENNLLVIGHEMLHRWGAHIRFKLPDGSLSSALLGRDGVHWSFLLDTDASVLYGADWRDNGDGTFTAGAVLKFWSPLDLYLAGFYTPQQVPPFFYIDSPGTDPTQLSRSGAAVTGTKRTVTVDDVIAAEGPRIPAAGDSQKRFRAAILVVTRPGETVTAAQIAGLNRMRREIETRFSALTGGQGLLEVAPQAVSGTPGAPAPLPGGGTPRPSASLVDGVSWLRGRQAADGSWTDTPATQVRDTVVALTTLMSIDAGFPPVNRDRALNFLRAHPGANTDFLARLGNVLQKVGGDGAAARASLLAIENADGGWGAGPGYGSDAMDTALAILALTAAPAPSATEAAAASRAAGFLVAGQNADGGWSGVQGGPSRTSVTATVLRALTASGLAGADAAAGPRALAWLANRQNRTDGGFGDSPSTVHDTANALDALIAVQSLSRIDATAASGYLGSRQTTEGSWDGSVYATAVALSALKRFGFPNWTFTGAPAVSPQSPRDGERVKLTFQVVNDGNIAAPAGLLRLYDGDPGQGGLPGAADAVLPPMGPGAIVTVTVYWDSKDKPGPHTLFAVIDPDGAVPELAEGDNQAAVAVAVQPAPALADLEVQAPDLAVSPAQPSSLPADLAISVAVRNLGHADAEAVAVELRTGPAQGGTVVERKTVAIPGRSGAVVNFVYRLTAPGTTTLRVAVDPDNTVPEDREDNNTASRDVSTGPSLDLAVADADLSISGTAFTGNDVTFKAVVHNLGTVDSPPAAVRFVVTDGTTRREIGRSTVLLAAGQSAERTVPWRVDLEGSLHLEVTIDPESLVPEADEGNNTASLAFTSGAVDVPNLTLSHTDLGFDPNPGREGKPLTLTANVRNNGGQPAALVEVAFYEGDPAQGAPRIGEVVTIPAIAAGGGAVATLVWPRVPDAGDRVIHVVVDPAHKIAEFSEDDNSAFEILRILSLPDAAVSEAALDLAPRFPAPSQPVTLTVTVSNLGEQDVQGLVVRAWDGDPAAGGTPVAADQVVNLPGSGSVQAVFHWIYASGGGSRPLVVTIDPDNAVEEGAKSNNTARLDVAVQQGDLFVTQRYFSPNGDGVQDTTQLFFRLAAPAQSLQVVDGVRNRVVRQQTLGGVAAGQFEWDGRDDLGRLVRDADYSLRLLDAGGAVLGETAATLDNDRSSLLLAAGTPFGVTSNLTCELPEISQPILTGHEDLYYFFVPQRPFDGPADPIYRRGVYRMSAEGGDVQPLVTADWFGARVPADLQVAPDGSKLAFVVNPNGFSNASPELWAANPDGSGLVKVTQDIALLGLSADGHTIYATDANGAIVALAPTAGATPRVLLADAGIEGWAFSPDRRHLVFTSHGEGNPTLLLDLETGASTVVASQPGPQFHLLTPRAWSADSRYLAIPDTGSGNLRIFDAAGHLVREIAPPPFDGSFDSPFSGGPVQALSLDPVWASSGSELAYQVHYGSAFCEGEAGGAIVRVDREGGEPEKVAATAGRRGCGELVARASSVAGARALNAPRAADEADETLPFNGSLLWDPGDRSLLYVTGASTQHATAIFLDEDNRQAPFLDTFGDLQEVRFSPTGRKLLFLSADARDNPLSPCYHRGSFDAWSFQSLLNLTADLRIRRSAGGSGGFLLEGTAADLHFSRYLLEYATASAPNVWRPVAPPGGHSVIDGRFTTWVAPGPDAYLVRLTVEDLAGNRLSRIKRVSSVDTPSLTDLYASPDYVSPNGDGVQDAWTVHYRVLAPVHLEFRIFDESGARVRTLERDHSVAGSEFDLTWDGRDDRGLVVPDGLYRLTVQGYEFFVVIDTTPPTVTIAATQLGNCGSPGAGVDFRIEELNFDLADRSLVVPEHGDVPAPSVWLPDNYVLKRIQGGRVPGTLYGGSFGGIDLGRIAGQLFRVEARDLAGNRTRVATSPAAEVLSVTGFGRHEIDPKTGQLRELTAVGCGTLLNLELGLARFSMLETVRTPLTALFVQFQPVRIVDGQPRLDLVRPELWDQVPVTVFVPALPGGALPDLNLEFLWTMEQLQPNTIMAVRVRAIDERGGEHFSGAFMVGQIQTEDVRLVGFLDRASDAGTLAPQVEAMLAEAGLDPAVDKVLWGTETVKAPLAGVTLLLHSTEDPRYATTRSFVPVAIRDGVFLFRMKEWQACRSYFGRLTAVTEPHPDPESGQTVTQRFETRDRELRVPCLSLDVRHSPTLAGTCGGPSGSAAKTFTFTPTSLDGAALRTLTFTGPGADGRPTLLYNVNLPQSGQSYTFTFDTSGVPEGRYDLVARLTNANDQVTVRKPVLGGLDDELSLIVDRTPPVLSLSFPQEGQRVCGVRRGADSVVDIQGLIQDAGGFAYTLGVRGPGQTGFATLAGELWLGPQGETYRCPPTAVRRPEDCLKILIDPREVGTLATLRNQTGDFAVHLEAVDNGGFRRCVDRGFYFDGMVEGPGDTIDRVLISPNGDGVLDDATVTFRAAEPANVDVKVYPAKFIYTIFGRTCARTGPAVRTVGSQIPILDLGAVTWNGRDDGGNRVADGVYQVGVAFRDACGNQTELSNLCLEVDDTPPALSLAYPHAGDPLALVVEARGSVADLHLQGWSLDFGQGTDPETWARIRGGAQEIDNDFLGAWNTFGLEGDQTLRILAVDKAGNQGELRVPVVLPTRTGLIAYLEGAPRIFSPNGDGKLETASLRFGLVNEARVDLTILDAGGAPVARLLTDQAMPSGSQVRAWDGNLTGGVPAPDGTYRAELAARLQSNPNVTQRESVTVDLDRTPPSIQITRPVAAGFVTPTGAITGTVQDAHLTEYVVSLTGTPQAPAWQELTRGTVSRQDFPFATLEGLDEGDYALRVQASDAGQILAEKIIPFTVDSTPPAVHLTAPVAGSVAGAVGGPLAIAGTIVEIHLASWRLEAGRGAEPASWTALASGDTLPQPLAAAWNLTGVADGLWTLRLVAVDRAGQTSETRVAVTVDNTPPTALLTQPAEGGYVTGPRAITGTATDANLAEYRLAVAAGTGNQFSDLGAGSAPVTAGHLLDWLTLPPDGPQTLRLTVTDRAGNQSAATVRVTVDTQPPGAPRDLVATLEQQANARLTWRPNTEPDLAGYVIDRDGVRVTPQPVALATYLDAALADGLHAYTVRAVDRAGQESPPSVAAQVKVDHSAPLALIFQPAAGARVGGVVDVKGTAFSSDDFKELRLFAVPGTGGAQLLRRSPVPVQAGLLAQWSTLGLPEDAAYTLRLEAEDVAGNVATATAAVIVDNRPPAAPAGLAGVVSAATVNLAWNANTEPDLAGYLLYRDGRLVNALGPVVGDLTPYLLTSTAYADAQLPDGTFTYQVYAVDKAGNISDPSAAVQVTVDNRAPHAVITLPADGSSFDGSVYVLATTPDTDVARVQLQYKSTASSVWTDLGPADTAAPWETDWAPGALARGAYQLRAVATDRGNRTDPAPAAITVTYADLTPPPAPLGLSAHVDGGDVTLAWTAVSDPGLAGYHVERANADGSVERLTPAPVTAVTFLDSGVADGVYGYHVLSVDAAGNESAVSADVPATVSTPRLAQPYTPTAGTSTALAGTTLPDLQVTGSATGPGGASPLPPLTADAQGLFAEPDLPLARGETALAVRGTDAAGNRTKEAAVPVVSDEAPAPPTGLVAAAPAGTLGVELSWNANTESDLLGYRLLRDDQPVPAPRSIADFTGATDPDDAGAAAVIDGDLNSVWFPYSTPGPDGPWLQVTWPERRLIARVEIDWGTDANTEGNLAVLNAVNYDVEAWDGRVWVAVARVRGDAGAASRIVLAQPYRTDRLRLLFLASSIPPEIAELRVYHHPLVTATSTTDTATDGAHAWRLIAVDQLGLESAPSAAAGLTVAPPDPVVLTAAATGADVLLTWTASPSAVRYDIFRDGAKVAETADLTYTDAARPNGVYRYTVRAVDGVGNSSAASNEAAVTIALSVPAAPVSLTLAVLPEGGALSLAWTPGAGPAPAAYRLLRGTTPGGPYSPVTVTGGIGFVDRGLANGQLYAYVVVALDGLGNASATSNEASGTPADTVAPAAPVLHFPGFPGLPATTQADHTPVVGTAEPGAAVTLFRNGTPVGQVTAQAQDVRSDATSGAFGLALLSPDGRYLLSGSFGFGALYDFKTGLSTEVPSLQESPAWLPDASGLTFLSNGVIHLYRLAGGADSILLTPGDSDFLFTAIPAPDARTLAVFGSHDGAFGLWRVDTTAGTAGTWSSLSAEGEVDSRSLAASPDGSAFAFRRSAFNDQSLVVVRGSGGGNPAVTVVEPNPGPSPLHWSPGGDTLLYTAVVNGVEEVHSFRLADGTSAVLAAGPEDRSEPVWSPDGRSLYYAIQRAGVFRRDLPAGEPVQVLDAAGSGSFIQLDTAAAGYVVAVINDVPVRIAPAGRFELGSVGLDAGENTFTALAADAAGTQSPASAPMIVNRIAGARPNLAIAVTDLALLPAAPLAGSVARVTVTVHNQGTVPSPGAGLSIAIVGPNGFNIDLNTDLSAGSSLGPLAPGGTQTLTRDVALGAAGRYTLTAAADPLDHLAETDETDNRAQKEFMVAAAGVPTVTVATDRAVVPAGGVLGVAADLVNYGDPLSGRLTVTVEDAGGVALATLLDQPVTGLAYAATLHRDLTWSPGTAFAGSYQVSARLFDPAGVPRAEAHAAFAVGAFVQVTAGVETDRGSYAAGSTVRITGTVDYRDGNQPLAGAVARILVFGSGEAPLAEIVRELGDLLPGSQGTVTADWPSGTAAAGSYRARLVVEQGGASLTSAETRFDLTTGAVTAEGTLVLSDHSPAWGSALDATLTVRNRGTSALTQLPLRVRVQDPAAGTVLATVPLAVDLPAGGSATRTVPLDTRAIGLGNRLVVLEADLPASGASAARTVTLDAASLTVVDATPPVVSIIAPAAGATTGTAVTVTVSARDALSPVRKAEASLDGGAWQTLDLRDAGAGLYGRNLTGLAEGDHVLSARATDSWGNVGVAAPVTFTVVPVATGTPHLTATKVATLAADADGDGRPSPGDVLEYQVTIANTGNAAATGVVFVDPAPSYATVVPGSVTASAGTVASTGGESPVRVTVGSLAPAGRVDIRFRVSLDAVVPAGVSSVSNQGAVTSDQLPGVLTDDPAVGGAADPTVTAITAEPRLVAELTDSLAVDADGNGSPSPGDTVEYRAVVRNAGNRATADVVLTLPLPLYTSAVAGSAITTDGTVASFGAAGLRVEVPELPGGRSATVTFRMRIDGTVPAGVRQISLQGQVASAELPAVPTDDPRAGGSADPTVTPVTAAPSLTATKTATLFADADHDGAASPGDTLLYRIEVVNGGNTAATGVTVNDAIPAGTELEAGSVQVSQGSLGSESPVAAQLGALAAGASAVVTFRVRVASPFPRSLTAISNQASVASVELPLVSTDDPATPAMGDATVTPIVAMPLLTAGKTAALANGGDVDGDGRPSPGDVLEYHVTIANTGNTSATGVTFTDSAPVHTTVVPGSVTSSAGSVDSESPLQVTVGELGAGGRVDVRFQVAVDAVLPAGVSSIANQGAVASDQLPGVLTDDPAVGGAADPTVTALTAAPRLTSELTDTLAVDADGNGSPSPGDTLEYRAVVRNAGNTSATQVVLTAAIPTHTTAVAGSAVASPGTVTAFDAGGLRADLGELVGGQSATVTFRVKVDATVPAGVRSVSLQGQVASAELAAVLTDDPGVGGAADPTVTQIAASPVLTATKTATLYADADNNGVASPGDTLLYRIQVVNGGNTAATTVTVNDPIPAGVTLEAGSVQAGQGTVTSEAPPRVDLGELAAGASAVVTFRVRVDSPFPTSLAAVSNQATVTSAELPAVVSDDPATPAAGDATVTPITAAPRLSALLTATLAVDADANGLPSPGDTLEYRAVLNNAGNRSATSVVLTAPIPARASAVAGSAVTSSGSVASFDAGGLNVSIGTLPVGSSVTVTFRVRIDATVPAGVHAVSLQGAVASAELRPVPTDDPGAPGVADPTVTPLTAAPALAARKTAVLLTDADADGLVSPGDTLLYRIEVANAGNTSATAVVVSDALPAGLTFDAGSIQVTQGSVTSEAPVRVDLGEIVAGGSAAVTFRVHVVSPFPSSRTAVSNQGSIASNELAVLATDDPATPALGDPTVTPVVVTPRVSIDSAAGTEGQGPMTFTVRLSTAANHETRVSWTTVDGTAVAGADFVAVSGTLVFAAGETSKTLQVILADDAVVETDETFTVRLSAPIGAVLGIAEAAGTIHDDDTANASRLAIADTTVAEGDTGTASAVFTVTLTPAASQEVRVAWATANGTATAGADYTAASGTLVFAAGQTTKTIAVPVLGDQLLEPDETFLVNLTSPVGATINRAQATGTLRDDEQCAGPNLLVNAGAESPSPFLVGALVFPGWNVAFGSLPWQQRTADPAPLEGGAYFAPGVSPLFAELYQDVPVAAWAQPIDAGGQSFGFAGWVRTRAETPSDTARIVVEYRNAANTVVLDAFDSGDLTSTTAWRQVTSARPAPAGTRFVRVRLLATRFAGLAADGYFDSLSLTSLRAPVLTAGDTTVYEAASGTTNANFTVTLSCPYYHDVTVHYATADGTALAGSDYQAVSGTLSFPAGTVSRTVAVPVVGDAVDEPHETFYLDLSQATPAAEAVLGDARGQGLIVNDDYCAKGPGYWKTHPTVWPASSLVLGGRRYIATELLAILSYSGPDGATHLARQLIATKLNLLVGSAPSILPSVDDADAFLALFPPGSNPKGSSKTQANTIKDRLEHYNEDNACDDD